MNQGVVGRVLTRHVGLKPDLRSNEQSRIKIIGECVSTNWQVIVGRHFRGPHTPAKSPDETTDGTTGHQSIEGAANQNPVFPQRRRGFFSSVFPALKSTALRQHPAGTRLAALVARQNRSVDTGASRNPV